MDRAQQTFERLFGPEFGHGKAFDLARLKRALSALGDPQTKLPPVIHVAGTNGKGSTIAFMRAIAEAAGLAVHAFTKPHLLKLNERFVVAGGEVGDAALIDAAERVARVDAELTQFDAQVAAAFLLFSETPADLVLLETGMGGRDDSTNVIERPALSVITPVHLDHVEALGRTIPDIAVHKAGIIKPGAPAAVGLQIEDVHDVLMARAAEVGAPYLRMRAEWLPGEQIEVRGENRTLILPEPTLLCGPHQAWNAALAAFAMLHWRDFTDDVFAAGIRNARLPARLEQLTDGALSATVRAAGGEVWIDGGHNLEAARWLRYALDLMQEQRAMTNIAIVGMRARKDGQRFVEELSTGVARFIFVPLEGDACIPPEELAGYAHELNALADTAPSLEAAMQNAAQSSAPRVLVCGSFLLAAEALRH
jgi:dihydrofolate synthase/folylpolyglutamate synthase